MPCTHRGQSPMQHKLKTYLVANELTETEFARHVRVSVYAVRKWVRGERIPKPKSMLRIERITNGEIPISYWIGYAALKTASTQVKH